MHRPFDLPANGSPTGTRSARQRVSGHLRSNKPLAVVVEWDPTAGAKRLLWIGLLGMLLCALVFSALNTFSARTHYMELGPLVILAYLLFTVAGLASVWAFLKGMWGCLFPRVHG